MAQQVSDSGTAHQAVSGFKNYGGHSSQSAVLGRSNISAMERAMNVCNQLVQKFSELESDVQRQANKFPELAEAIEQRDRNDKEIFNVPSVGFD